MRFLAILTVRNEASFLLEWLAHHRACGFTDFLVFSNDCDDGTDLMLDRLQAMGWLTHVRNPGPHKQGPQWAALKAADRHPLKAAADWVLFLDIDEFVNIHTGSRTLPDLLTALPAATAITLTWRMFGNAGVISYRDTPVTETFVRAAPAVLQWPWQAVQFKTLFATTAAMASLGCIARANPTRRVWRRSTGSTARGASCRWRFTPGGCSRASGATITAWCSLTIMPWGRWKAIW